MDHSRMQITIRPIRKPKRFRSAFSTEQIKFLELQFKKFPYISSEHRKEIATALNMQERAVKIWFQNRRMKEKKESINIEFDYITNKVEETGKDRLNNGCNLPSANEPLSYSLPIMKPMDTSSTFNNSDSIHRGIREKVETQQVPQNLSTKIKAPMPMEKSRDLNIKQQIPSLNIGATQRDDTPKKQFKRNATFSRKPAELSIDLSNRIKRSKKINNTVNADHKPRIQKELKVHPSIAAKLKTSLENFSSKKSTQSSRPPKQVKVNEPTYFPVMPTVYAHPYISSGGMIWKPINIMPIVAPGMRVPHNPQQRFEHDQKNCSCNCHGNTQPLKVPPNPIGPYAQYVITAPTPYQNLNPHFLNK